MAGVKIGNPIRTFALAKGQVASHPEWLKTTALDQIGEAQQAAGGVGELFAKQAMIAIYLVKLVEWVLQKIPPIHIGSIHAFGSTVFPGFNWKCCGAALDPTSLLEKGFEYAGKLFEKIAEEAGLGHLIGAIDKAINKIPSVLPYIGFDVTNLLNLGKLKQEAVDLVHPAVSLVNLNLHLQFNLNFNLLDPFNLPRWALYVILGVVGLILIILFLVLRSRLFTILPMAVAKVHQLISLAKNVILAWLSSILLSALIFYWSLKGVIDRSGLSIDFIWVHGAWWYLIALFLLLASVIMYFEEPTDPLLALTQPYVAGQFGVTRKDRVLRSQQQHQQQQQHLYRPVPTLPPARRKNGHEWVD